MFASTTRPQTFNFIVGRWLRMETDELLVCEADPRVGGKLRLVVRRDGEEVEQIGEYRDRTAQGWSSLLGRLERQVEL